MYWHRKIPGEKRCRHPHHLLRDHFFSYLHSVCFNVKYFTPKIFYIKYFHFTVFGFVPENSFASVCFMVK